MDEMPRFLRTTMIGLLAVGLILVMAPLAVLCAIVLYVRAIALAFLAWVNPAPKVIPALPRPHVFDARVVIPVDSKASDDSSNHRIL